MKDIIIILLIFAAVIFAVPFLVGNITGSENGSDSTDADTVFPDELHILLTETNEIVTVSAEEYLTGCLCAQIPINYEVEALKAQACASATYAMKLMSTLKGSGKLPDGADLTDEPSVCQPYYTPGKRLEIYGDEYEKFRGTVEAAANYGKFHIITYNGEPIYSVYHSVSTGKTCPSQYVWGIELDYLSAVDSIYDKDYLNYTCTNEMKPEDIRAALLRYNGDIDIPADYARWFTDMNANEDGYVISVNIGKNTFSGGDMWRILGLRSTAFTVTYTDGIFTFTTKGYGHGAGLSQYGANEMARSGSTAEQILRHYYGKDVNIT